MTQLPRLALGISNRRAPEGIVRAVEEAEWLSAEVAFVSEDINNRDAFSLASLSAPRTTRIKLATGVVNPYTRSPMSLAMGIATLDEVSGGRAILGLGSSSPSLVQDQLGIAYGNPVEIMREATNIVRALLTGEPVNYNGRRFVYREAQLEVRPVQSHVPVYFAAMGPQMLRLAGEIADGVLLNVGASTGYVRWALSRIHEGCRRAGRSPAEVAVSAWISAYIRDDGDQGLDDAKAWLSRMLSIPRQGELLLRHGGFDDSILPRIREAVTAYPQSGNAWDAARHVPDQEAISMAIVGTVEQAQERLSDYRSAGVDIAVLGPSALRLLARA